jgi:hypothetical protein
VAPVVGSRRGLLGGVAAQVLGESMSGSEERRGLSCCFIELQVVAEETGAALLDWVLIWC